MKSEPVRIPVIMHTNTFVSSFESFHDLWDSSCESKSDGEGSNFSLDLASPAGLSVAQEQTTAIECKWTECGKTFRQLDELAAHVTSIHAKSGPGGLFFCGWQGCGRGDRGFNARYKMLVHVRTHTNEKPHHCCQCDKSFSRAENLKIHARSHTGERPYVCPVTGCGKAYSNSSDRFKHTRTHSVDKPYICKVTGCGKRYTDPSSLRKHVKTYRHFPNQTQSDDQQKAVPEVFKMDEEMDHEQIVPQTDHLSHSIGKDDIQISRYYGNGEDSNLNQSIAKEHSQTCQYYCSMDENNDLQYKFLKNWFSLQWTPSEARSFDFTCRGYHDSLQDQDMPLDLTVHK